MGEQDKTAPAGTPLPLAAATSTSTSTSSFMSRFYTPMNPGVIPMPRPASPPPAPVTSQTAQYQQLPLAASGSTSWSQGMATTPAQTLGANAASLLANLAAFPGYLSNTAIQEARQEYARNQPGHQQSVVHTSPGHYDPGAASGATDATPSIEALLRELQQAGDPATSSSSTYSPPPVAPPYPVHSPSMPPTATPVVEDFSNGKITPQLLKRLAAIAEADAQEGGTLSGEIRKLQERQIKVEKSLFEDRQAVLEKHKKALIQLQASSEIMGVNITAQMQKTKNAHKEELKLFDKHVIRRMDKEITAVQESLSRAGVPTMSITQDPIRIAAQIRVLRLLEDMLQS
ncbi:hypothetical protein BGZ70_008070 [Mortierella alpina]|uniref:Uncharacterized protein n=1 Tax=Mortierella alpina TaxID=64518 RepID=A0A9P6J4Y1_MORAP|nr:hypothetical protein BGZ70_008070 [Mortierella alpina]